MKRFAAIFVACAMLMSMTACGSKTTDEKKTTIAPQKETTAATVEDNDQDTTTSEDSAQQTTTPTAEESKNNTDPTPSDRNVFGFVFQGVTLVPGTAFDASVLPQAESVYQVPSCAIEGTDNVYQYDTFELTAFEGSDGEVIYSIYLIDANTPTPEGLYLGDDLAAVISIYGEEYTENGTQMIYQKGNTLLLIIVENGIVSSIEYRKVL